MSEDMNNNNMLLSTPFGKTSNSTNVGIDFIDVPTSMNTPKGTKIYHPFLSSIFSNLNKQFTSPDMFNKNRKYPQKDNNILSPDLVGNLFPNEINTDVESQHQFEENIYKKYQSYFDSETSKFFTDNLIKPSPESHDSGIETSLQFIEPINIEIENNSTSHFSMFTHQTPPSKYKWNRPEYRSSKFASRSSMSFEDCDDPSSSNMESDIMESTQLDINRGCLADNLSMRQQSVIGSPMFYEDKIAYSFINNNVGSKEFMRSSPHSKFNARVISEISLSPIKSNCEENMINDDDFM